MAFFSLQVVISKKEDNVNTNAISNKLAAKTDFPVYQVILMTKADINPYGCKA